MSAFIPVPSAIAHNDKLSLDLLRRFTMEYWFDLVIPAYFLNSLKEKPWYTFVDPPLPSASELELEELDIWQQIEAINLILILYNLHLIPDKIFIKKYANLVERYLPLIEEFEDLWNCLKIS